MDYLLNKTWCAASQAYLQLALNRHCVYFEPLFYLETYFNGAVNPWMKV